MISLCTVIIGRDDEIGNNEIFESIFIESITQKLNQVSEILICKIDAKPSLYEEKTINGKKIIKFGYKNNFFQDCPKNLYKNDASTFFSSFGHPLGIKYAIDKASNNLIMMCDPDIFFYLDLDNFYYNLMEKYNLDYIGACPHLSYLYSTKYFPNILCMLTKKTSLPENYYLNFEYPNINSDSLSSYLYNNILDDEYLIGQKIDSLASKFPNPEGIFDTGVYLWLWANQNNQNWLAFQPNGIHLYKSQVYRTNLKIRDRIPIQKLFYHATGGSRHLYLDQFMEEYRKSKEGDNDNSVYGVPTSIL